ncbi:MAG: DUF4215 domain-containing protein [Myxococcales bacterium]|nr:DUF4215 domain-containing protein [Myxococcales bacterium]
MLDVVGGEICDDGNTASNDGCAGDCLAAELAQLCDDAAPLTLDQPLAGTTIGGLSGYPSGCDPYIATTVATYATTPPAAGRLTLSLTSASADLGVSVYSDCADGGSELTCQNQLGDDVLFVDFDTAPALPALVIVRGASPSQAGAFELTASFTAALCGDGAAVGPEACDDGNTASGDGCSADCLTIEWASVCASLPALSTSSPNQGTTVGAPDYFDLAGICSFVNGGGTERAYAFVAPSNGVLHLTLAQPADDFSLHVEDGCGPTTVDNYVACSNHAPAGSEESITTPLVVGQAVTVIVDGFTAGDEGLYELTATFEPG